MAQAFFQHVGEENSERDFPRTLVSKEGNKIRFQFSQIERFLDLPADEKRSIAQRMAECRPDGFQIWGVPAGAESVIRQIQPGDVLLLLRTRGYEGRFGFAGRVLEIPRCKAHAASEYLWGEDRFPLLLLLDGGPSDLTWRRFREELGYMENWDPRGQTYRIRPDRLATSSFKSADGLLRAALVGPNSGGTTSTSLAWAGEAEPYDGEVPDSEEGRQQLCLHLMRERDPALVRAFKASLVEPRCCICGFLFEERYGWMGRGYIEAHHTIPVAAMQEGDTTAIGSIVPVCSNCHRMIHRRWPPHSVDEVRDAVLGQRTEAPQH